MEIVTPAKVEFLKYGECPKNVEQAIEIHIEGLVKTHTEVPSPDASDDVYFSQASVKAPKNATFIY